MDSEGMNPGSFDENDDAGNGPEEEQQYMAPWGEEPGEEAAAASPTHSGFQAEEVSYEGKEQEQEQEPGVSQEANGVENEYSGGDGAGNELAATQYTESSALDKDGNLEDGFAETSEDDGDGTVEEQLAFVKELEKFFRERSMEFKAPKFYGEELNCLKLWKAVMKLGGYEQVTSGKLWRQVGDSFKPPKTCTTISWSFRGFYEKALLEYEKFTTGVSVYHDQPGDPSRSEDGLSSAPIQPPGRARRDAAARAMQGWHSQRGNGDLVELPSKDKSSARRDKRGFLKRKDGSGKGKKENSYDDSHLSAKKKLAKHEPLKGKAVHSGLDLDVIDEGPQADWVKINVHQTRECFEVYALVPGLLREEVRIQCEAGGRLVIAGEPEQPDNPWGVTAFRKVINLPLKIDAHQTSAVVTLHGQLFIRVPFAQSSSEQQQS
ncbi:hypothetical protein SELMODRAFT_445202 [Selaginella moellendorffii]|uniref:ARID domain-containing protein n=1 Tax=Selaginella moellendorffii TaxID=88036 RepID=D8SGN1_SELML|nr:AT-rich interactive domain-containing protein 5 [Selaginella moellendorffii]EFJ16229.1 hypothetical protein SELMODRAFT_445202 [Selaginella moellendorffii]|eukprot:XP_002982476.1 AT-rich interactive domain-containing protein 5 [Selaginella moellendorffii]